MNWGIKLAQVNMDFSINTVSVIPDLLRNIKDLTAGNPLCLLIAQLIR